MPCPQKVTTPAPRRAHHDTTRHRWLPMPRQCVWGRPQYCVPAGLSSAGAASAISRCSRRLLPACSRTSHCPEKDTHRHARQQRASRAATRIPRPCAPQPQPPSPEGRGGLSPFVRGSCDPQTALPIVTVAHAIGGQSLCCSSVRCTATCSASAPPLAVPTTAVLPIHIVDLASTSR